MFSKETETVSMLRKMLTGVGFMADTYDLFVINMVVDIMKDVYSISQLEETLIKTSALFGAVIGQIAFGYFADKIGRKWIFVSTCLLTICGSIGSAVVGNSGGWTVSQWLIFARFFLGIGIGGEYPLSATITAENEGLTDDEVITNLSLTFSMQGVGQILCGMVLILITQFVNEPNLQWRLALGFGALPMIVSFFYRWHMDETKHFKEIVQQQQTQNRPNNTRSSYLVPLVSDQDNTNNSGQLSIWDSIRANWIQLLGAAGSWFLLDIVFYGNGLFSSSITEAMGTADGNKSKAVQVFILQLISFPGYFCSVWFLAKQGCKVIQDRGFIAITLIFAIMALLQPYLKTVGPLYIIIYGLTFFFENYGANTTTFIIPAITFPTNSRATCHGISAAAGKLGAIFGVFILSYLKNSFCSGGECNDDDETGNIDKGLQLTFGFCAFIGILGYLWSYFFVLTDKVDKTLNVVNSETEATTTA